jgi:prepilin-type N-terminal cleavage/methylation domain-containing protein
MNSNIPLSRQSEKGFTLVELAVVMIIIGLLIGGILKGQELIANAQIASSVAEFKAVDAATSTFRDSYNALPGDITNPDTRLPNCPNTVACGTAGNGNSVLETAPDAAAVAGSEATNFWAMLNAADLLGGVDGSAILAFGQALPSSSVGGGMVVGHHPTGALGDNGTPRSGTYVSLRASPEAAEVGAAGAGVITPSQAGRIDRKMDDGSPTTGSVFGQGAALCGAGQNYNEQVTDNNCNLFVRIQG